MDIAVLGMGAMGARITGRLVAAGHSLHIWNRTPERCQPLVGEGVAVYRSPRDAAQMADVVIAMVADDEASRQVWLDPLTGAMDGLQKGAIALEYSTLTPGWGRELAQKMTSFNHRFLAAPVVGSRPQADSGQLIQLVGGDVATLDAVQPILECHSAVIYSVGDVTTSLTLKLAVNTLLGIQVAALGEVLGILHKVGMPPSAAVDLLNQMPTASPALKGIGTLMVAQNYAPLFPIDLIEKDLRYAQAVAQALGSKVPVIDSAWAVYRQAQESGYGADNIAGVAQLHS
ncbi:MAG: NAD(P)-dependent oxidoreductase [Leptolyngbyaceae cyanobacterium]